MKIFIAADHAGFELKKFLVEKLSEDHHEMIDCGAHQLIEDDDYPKYISKAARDVSECEIARMRGAITNSPNDEDLEVRGIVIGGSGQGEAIMANRYESVRAAVYYGGPEEIVTLSREHNDANILSLGARFLSETEALKVVKLWLKTKFSGEERHIRRIGEVDLIAGESNLFG
ncbi:MAG: RpiB/LacA/LacB family sugar-phosphate isomerase [Patescibacteria group bacterium]